jgi:hypothetical protein
VKPTIYENVAVVFLLVRVKDLLCANRFDSMFSIIQFFLKNQQWQCILWLNTALKRSNSDLL